MYYENDEGIGPSPTSTSYRREFPSFEADATKNTTIIFPQKLDLSGLNEPEYTEIRKPKKSSKKPSPIKAHHDSAVYSTGNNYRTKRVTAPVKIQTTDLSKYRDEINAICGNINQKITRNNSISSNTSDRASSISSTSSDQRSLSVEIKRAQNIITKLSHNNYTKVFNESNFKFDETKIYYDDDSTRPPSSEASLCHEEEVEVREEARGENKKKRRESRTKKRATHLETYNNRKDLISHLTNVGLLEAENARRQIEKERKCKNAATNTSGILSTEQLLQLNSRKSISDEDTVVESNHRDHIEKAFEDFGINDVVPPTYRTDETPILCSTSTIESTRGSIEVVRDAASTTEHHHPQTNRHLLHHSYSSTTMLPKEPIRKYNNLSLPNLQRFIVRPSTRDIFNAPIDIDQICGKGLKRDLKSTEKNFGGSEVAKSVHGCSVSQSAPTTARRNLEKSKRAQSSTIASTAKQRSVSKTRNNKQPPYCSTTKQNMDGVSYSVGSVSQEFLGTIKTLYPEWLPLAHRVIDEPMEANIVEIFRSELNRQVTAKEIKYHRNRQINGDTMTCEEFDNITTKMDVIRRISDKLSNNSNKCPRVQQLRLIQSVLLSA